MRWTALCAVEPYVSSATLALPAAMSRRAWAAWYSYELPPTVVVSITVMDAYINAGGNFIDTANIYTKGHLQRSVDQIRRLIVEPIGHVKIGFGQRVGLIQVYRRIAAERIFKRIKCAGRIREFRYRHWFDRRRCLDRRALPHLVRDTRECRRWRRLSLA